MRGSSVRQFNVSFIAEEQTRSRSQKVTVGMNPQTMYAAWTTTFDKRATRSISRAAETESIRRPT